MTTVNIAAQSFPVGNTVIERPWPAGAITAFGITADCSAWVQPGSLQVGLEFSYDGAITWNPIMFVGQATPPPWVSGKLGVISSLNFSAGWNVPVTPTHVRLSVDVGGAFPITVGPTVVTLT